MLITLPLISRVTTVKFPLYLLKFPMNTEIYIDTGVCLSEYICFSYNKIIVFIICNFVVFLIFDRVCQITLHKYHTNLYCHQQSVD